MCVCVRTLLLWNVHLCTHGLVYVVVCVYLNTYIHTYKSCLCMHMCNEQLVLFVCCFGGEVLESMFVSVCGWVWLWVRVSVVCEAFAGVSESNSNLHLREEREETAEASEGQRCTVMCGSV